MTFSAILRNRLGTEEVKMEQRHLDVLTQVLNMDPPPSRANLNDVVLHKCEQLDGPRPFPHNVAMFSIGSDIEDVVAFCPFGWDELGYPSNLWLGEWITGVFKHKQDEETLYTIIREYMTDKEHSHFDLKATRDEQANFLLLVAHAYYFEYEAPK